MGFMKLLLFFTSDMGIDHLAVQKLIEETGVLCRVIITTEVNGWEIKEIEI